MARTVPLLIALGLLACGSVLFQACSDTVTSDIEVVKLLEFSVDSLEFQALAGQNPNPAQQKVRLSISSRAIRDWSASYSSTWIRLGPTGTDTIFVSVISTDLPTGVYHDTIAVTSPEATNTPIHLPVRLTVSNRLVVTPSELSFTGLAGGHPPDSQAIEITDFIGGTLSYDAVTDAPWLSLAATTGSVPDTLWVRADPSGMDGGRYTDSIVVTSTDLPGFSLRLICRLFLSSWLDQNIGAGSAAINLIAVRFVDTEVGWLSAWLPSTIDPHGYVYRTDDGGVNWNRMLDLGSIRFGGLDAVDAATCFVVGDSATIWFTRNSGLDWQKPDLVDAADNINLSRVAFAGHRYGWAVGLSGTVVHTSDSGKTWHTQATPTSFDLTDVGFLDQSTGWVAGNHGVILYTDNGGAIWAEQNTGTTRDLQAVSFTTPSEGWAAGAGGTLLHTLDGGTNWQTMGSGVDLLLKDVEFVSSTRGWIVGLDGTIRHTNDAGITWIDQPTEKDVGLSDVEFATDSLGWVVGDKGVILNTASGGF